MIEHRQPHTIRAGEPRLVLPEVPAWMNQTPCSSTDPEAFFPEQGNTNAAARKVCAECPVRLDCLRYALEENIHDGIWGGLTSSQRRKLLKKRAA